jgi:thioesterase-3
MASEVVFSAPTAVTQADVDDSLYAHVHHARIVRFLEEGRTRFLESLGFTLEHFMTRQLLIVVSKLSVQYRRELTAGPIAVTSERPFVRGRKVTLGQRILLPDGKEAVRAEVELMFVCGKTRRAVSAPADFVKVWSTGCLDIRG